MALPLKIYKSSAGSGKTFTLVKEYLRLCLPDPQKFRKILAITFTNAAATEMKERILATLEALIKNKEIPMRVELRNAGLSDRDLNNAGILFELILNNYSWFNIGTIDRFFHRIIRSFNRELDLPADFELYLETEEALDYAVDNFLLRCNENQIAHELLIDFIREKISANKSWNVRGDLYKIAKELLRDQSIHISQADINEIREFIRQLKQLTKKFENGMHSLASRILEVMSANNLQPEDFKYGKSGPISFIINSTRELRNYEPKTRFLNALDRVDDWFKKDHQDAEKIQSVVADLILPLSAELYDYYSSHIIEYNSAMQILRNIYTFGVYEELNKTLSAFREEKNAVLIADFTRILARHISKEEISFIYSRIGSRYDHYLLDEFQDTSNLQWQSLKPLLENSVSQGMDCLVVGDSKQAIYRWRGGSVELIETTLPEYDFPRHTERLALKTNYRSSGVIINFNNLFFKNLPQYFNSGNENFRLIEKIYSDASVSPGTNGNTDGSVEINFIEKDERTRDSFRKPSNEKLILQVKECLEKGFDPKDIAILVRSKSDAEDAAKVMYDENIPFITQDALTLDNSPGVRLLLSVLHLIQNPSDQLVLSEIILLQEQYFTEDHSKEAGTWTSGIDSFEGLLPPEFKASIPELQSVPVYEALERAIRYFNIRKEDAYIERLRDAVLEYSLKISGNIADFLDWWNKGNFNLVLPDSLNAVRIMTIHKSKGLEFPVVIIPYADWDFFHTNNQDIMWVGSEIEPFNMFESLPVNAGPALKETFFREAYMNEEAQTIIDNLNLIYVAFTRPKQRLYINTVKLTKLSPDLIKNVPQLINNILNPSGQDIISFGNPG